MGVFDQIKSAFGRDGARQRKPAAQDPADNKAGAPAASAKTCTVRSGDTLWKIADENLGDGNRYMEIFEANRDVLDSPDHILPGQELKLP